MARASAKKDSSRIDDMRWRMGGAWSSHKRDRRKKASSEVVEVKVVSIEMLLEFKVKTSVASLGVIGEQIEDSLRGNSSLRVLQSPVPKYGIGVGKDGR